MDPAREMRLSPEAVADLGALFGAALDAPSASPPGGGTPSPDGDERGGAVGGAGACDVGAMLVRPHPRIDSRGQCQGVAAAKVWN